MPQSLMPEARHRYWNNDGVTPLAGGLLYTYAAGTSTPKATYTDSAGLVPHDNPIELDAKGEAVIYWDGAYKVDLKTSAGVQITGYPVDDYTPPTDTLRTALAASTGGALIGGGAQVVSSITALRGLLKTSASTKAIVTGYYADGDGGGGVYYYDSTDTTTADNGGTVIVATDGGRWKLQILSKISVKQFGAKGDGVTNDVAAFNAAVATGRRVYAPAGSYVLGTSFKPGHAGFVGDGPEETLLIFNGTHGIEIASDAGFDRPACLLQGFAIDSNNGTSCDSNYAFYIPGVASGAAAVYNSGITIRDVEIGRNGRFGGGFYVKDAFRMNVENVGLTDVSWMIRIVGSVVQTKFRNVTSNNDSAGSSLNKYGISTESATYSTGALTPENVRFIDCSYIRGTRGINHAAGLLVEFENFDSEADEYGMLLNAACMVRGGLVAPGTGATAWTGLFRGVAPSNPDDGTIIDGLDINCIRLPGTPASSYGIDIGNGASPVYGVVLKNIRIRGENNSLTDGIRGRDCRDITVEDCFIRTSAIINSDMNITGRRMFINRNRVPSGTLVIADDTDPSAYGQVTRNQCSTLTFTPTFPNNWDLMFNESGLPTRRFVHCLTATATWDPGNLVDTDAAATNVTCSGAAVGDAALAFVDIGARTMFISAHVSATDTVRVSLLNEDGGAIDLASGTVRVWVFKAS